MRSVHRVLLWRAAFGRVALGRAVWRAAFGHVGSAYRHTMIWDARVVVKGGFSGICRRTQEGIPAYAGMTVVGTRESPACFSLRPCAFAFTHSPSPSRPTHPLPSFPRRRESSASLEVDYE